MNAPSFVLDASTTLAWCFEDESSADAEQILQRLETGEAFAPALWQLEVGNALLGAERRGHSSRVENARFLELLCQLPIRIEDIPAARAWGEILALAREQNLSTYDATYLDLAIRLGSPLATLDETLRQAAKRCSVETL